jgi:hypothetical protein
VGAQEPAAGSPLCIVGADTQEPCGNRAVSRVGQCLLCAEHRNVPGFSREVERAEVAVWHLSRLHQEALRADNDLLIGLAEDAFAEAEEVRKGAYRKTPARRVVGMA